MTRFFQKTSIRFFVALLVFVTLALLSFEIVSSGLVAYASDNNVKFDNTSIFDDLYGSKDEHGNEFDLGNYPKDKDGELRFYTFVEYGYSYYANLDKNYALYTYLYNPQQLDFSTYLDSNVVRMATAFVKNSEGEYVASEYDDFNIVCVSRTTGDYANLFYKFKILDPEKKLLALAQKYESENGCRRYDIAGVYLKTDKSDVTLDKNIGRSFKCSGYMATYGENANNPSTFMCKVDVLETLDLKVYQTSYLTGVSSLGAYHHNNVSSVYFAIPQRVFDKYGSLWEIYAQWYECKTAPILVTSNQDFYQKALSNNHYETIDNSEGGTSLLYDKSVDYLLWYGRHSDSVAGFSNILHYDWAYNLRPFSMTSGNMFIQRFANSYSNVLPFVFYSPSYTDSGAFNVINKQTVAGDVTSSSIRDYIQNYASRNYVSWHTSRNLPSELFVNEVDSTRSAKGIQVGLNKIRTNLQDTFDLNSYNSNHSWWDKLWEYGWSYPKDEALDESHTNVSPFEEVKQTSLNSSSIASDLLINENDIESFKTFCNVSYGKNEVPYLFRFAVSDYTSRPITRNPGRLDVDQDVVDSYLAQETVFFDFNIITMTFKGEEDYYTLAVMHSPVDVIAGVEPPPVELTPGEHLVNNFLTAMQKIWDWFKNSDFLKALKILGLIIVGIIVALILIKIIAFIVKCASKRKNNHTVDYKAIKTPVSRDKSKCVRSAKAKSATKANRKRTVKNVKKKE